MPDSLRVLCNVLNSLPNSVIVYGTDGKVIDANQAACITHGVDQISDLGASEEVKGYLLKALAGEYCTTEYCITNLKTGKERWLKVHCNPVYTDSTTPVGASFFEKDITSQKEIMKELIQMKVKG